MTTTDTPRKDASKPKLTRESYDENWNMKQTDTPRMNAYYAGKGCECSARSRSECGCDVDWTDPRIYALEAEVKFWKAKAYEAEHQEGFHEAEVERLRGQLQQAIEIAEVFESELDEYHSVDRNCPDAAWHYIRRSKRQARRPQTRNKMTTTDTPRTDACPHCGAKYFSVVEWGCGTTPIIDGDTHRSPLCKEREARQKLVAEVERLKKEHRKLSHELYVWKPYCADFSEKIKPSL